MKPTDTTIKSIKVTIPHYSNRANMMMGEIDKFINNLAINTYDDNKYMNKEQLWQIINK